MKHKFLIKGLPAMVALSLFSCSQSEIVNVTTTEPGHLSEQLSPNQWKNTKQLSITGPLNELDILFIKALDNNGLEKLDLSKAENIENLLFYFDSNRFSSITLPDNVQYIGNETFQCCKNLKEINISSENKKFVIIEGILYSKDTTRLVAYPAKLTLDTYTIPTNVNELPNCVFAEAKSLKRIEIKEGNSNFTTENGVLYNYNKSRLIAYPSGKTDSIFTLPKSVTEVEWSAFWGNNHLKGINVEEGNPIYASIDGLLTKRNQDNSQTLVAFPAGRNKQKYTLPKDINTVGSCAFRTANIDTLIFESDVYGLEKWSFFESKINNVLIPKSEIYTQKDGIIYKGHTVFSHSKGYRKKCHIKEALAIDERALQRCNVEELTIGPTLAFGHFACSFCTSLKKAILEEGSEEIKGIGLFLCCPQLEEAELPSTIKNIGNKMFYGCFSLKRLVCKAINPPAISINAFDGVDVSKCIVYVPSKALETYRNSEKWKMFKNIKPILE